MSGLVSTDNLALAVAVIGKTTVYDRKSAKSVPWVAQTQLSVRLLAELQPFPLSKGTFLHWGMHLAVDAASSAHSFQRMTMLVPPVLGSAKSCPLTLGPVPVI